jgi:hypothetical protein
MADLVYLSTKKQYVNTTRRMMIDMKAGVATSYGWHVMGLRAKCGTWVFTRDAYSVSTRGHIGHATSQLASMGYDIIHATNVDAVVAILNAAFDNPEDSDSNMLKALWLAIRYDN